MRRMVRLALSALAVLGGCGGGSDTGIVRPVVAPVTVRISPEQLTLAIGESGRLGVEITGGRPAPTLVSCTSANPAVVTAAQEGSGCAIRAVAPGTTGVTATLSDGKTAVAQVLVPAPPPVVVTMTPTALPLNVGESGTLSVQISGGLPTPSLATCTSASTGIAVAVVVGSACRVTAVAAGNTTVTARTSGGQEVSSSVNVTPLPPALGALTVAPATATLLVGQTVALVAAANPASSAVLTQFRYESNSTAATVSPTGLVSAERPGTAVITVTATGQGSGFTTVTRSAIATITVEALPPAITGFTLTPSTLTLVEGQTGQLSAVVERGGPAVVPTVSYVSGRPDIVTISPTGALVARSPGEAIITASVVGSGPGFTTNGRTAAATITVTQTPPPPVTVRVTPAQLTVIIGTSGRLSVEITGGRPTPTLVGCTSSNPAVVTTARDGTACVVQAVASGTANVTATASDGASAVAQITVPVPPPVVVTMTPASLPLNVGDVGTFSVQISGGLVTPTLASCTSGSASIALVTVLGSGCRVTGVGVGSTTVTARTTAGQEAAASVTVTALPPALGVLTVAPPTATLPVGQTVALVANANPASTAVQTQFRYESNSAAATVSATGLVTAERPGTAVITVTATGQGTGFTTVTRTATATITVEALPPGITSLAVQPTTLSLEQGSTAQLTATVQQPTGAPAASLFYGTTAPAVASVSDAGLVTAVASGTAVITVTATSAANANFAAATRTQLVPITVTQRPAPILVDRGSLTIDSVAPGFAAAPLVVEVTTTAGRSLSGLQLLVTYQQAVSPWLTALLSSTTTPATLTLRATAAGLPEGDYVADVGLGSSNASHVPATVRVTMRVRAPGRVIMTPATVSIGPLDPAEPPVNTPLTVTSSNGATLTGLSARVEHVGATTGWLTATPLATTAAPTATVSLRTSASGLGNGTFEARVIVSTSIAGIAPDTTLVTLVVRREAIVLAPANLAFTLRTGAVSNAVVVNVSSLTGDALSLDSPVAGARFYEGTASGWITNAALDRAQLPLTLTVVVSAAGLAPGTYAGGIELYARNQAIRGSVRIVLTVIP